METSMASDDDNPITLAEACEKIFGGQIKPASLRAEAERGYLTIFRIGRRDFTTLAFVREMIKMKCGTPRPPETRSAPQLSESDHLKASRAALAATLAEIKAPRRGPVGRGSPNGAEREGR
jgi:hypothetical protein